MRGFFIGRDCRSLVLARSGQPRRDLSFCTCRKVWSPMVATWYALRQLGLAIACAMKWLAPGTISRRWPFGSDQLCSDSSAMVTASARLHRSIAGSAGTRSWVRTACVPSPPRRRCAPTGRCRGDAGRPRRRRVGRGPTGRGLPGRRWWTNTASRRPAAAARCWTARGSRPVSCRTPCSVAAQALASARTDGNTGVMAYWGGRQLCGGLCPGPPLQCGGRVTCLCAKGRVRAGRKVGAP